MKLHNCGKIEVRSSPIEGFGVFATADIKAEEVLEEVPFVMFPHYYQTFSNLYQFLDSNGTISESEVYLDNLRSALGFKHPDKYYFKWAPEGSKQIDGKDVVFNVLPLGFGPIYNTANVGNNAGWIVGKNTFKFVAQRDIEKDEEIRTFYGYFVDEGGGIFNTAEVFNLGIQTSQQSQPEIKCIRASGAEIAIVNTDGGFAALKELLSKSNSSLFIHSIESIEEDRSTVKYRFEFPAGFSTKFTYSKLKEFKSCRLPFTRINVSYTKDSVKNAAAFMLKNR